MKFTAIISALAIASVKEAHAQRNRRLNDIIKGDESDASSMSYASILSDTGASSSKPKPKSRTPPTNKGQESDSASIWSGLVLGISRNPSLKDELFQTAVFGTAVANGGTDDPRDIVDAYNNIQEAIKLLTPRKTCGELFPDAALANVTLICCDNGNACCGDVSDRGEIFDQCEFVGNSELVRNSGILFGGSCVEA